MDISIIFVLLVPVLAIGMMMAYPVWGTAVIGALLAYCGLGAFVLASTVFQQTASAVVFVGGFIVVAIAAAGSRIDKVVQSAADTADATEDLLKHFKGQS